MVEDKGKGRKISKNAFLLPIMNVYFFQNFATLKAQLVRPWRRQIRLELLSCYLLGPTAVVNNNVEVAQLIPLISRLSCQKIEVPYFLI